MVQTSRSAMTTPGQGDEEAIAAGQKNGKSGHRGRVFDYGELRLLLLAMLAEQPSHGYELIHEVKERFGGLYKPSPGVIYPTLTWLYDRGYTVIDLEKGGRKRYTITDGGRSFLAANKAVTEMLLARVVPKGNGKSPEQIVDAMDHLKRALSLRIKLAPVGEGVVEKMAAVIHAAADQLEELLNAPPLGEATLMSVADIATPNADRFLRRLSSHFQHRTPVVTDKTSGQFRMSMGEVRMEAMDGVFRITVTSSRQEKLEEMQEIMVRHLEEAAVREVLEVNWRQSRTMPKA
ncbi:DUF2218 domain-containing protein [Sodalis sp. RH16]|uniref:DUF2218 domain-containing protein n=1 Tax=unclassified Sodalis (in: enterobacteria) TaxID=2636512 RepID=UPI0039B61031